MVDDNVVGVEVEVVVEKKKEEEGRGGNRWGFVLLGRPVNKQVTHDVERGAS